MALVVQGVLEVGPAVDGGFFFCRPLLDSDLSSLLLSFFLEVHHLSLVSSVGISVWLSGF